MPLLNSYTTLTLLLSIPAFYLLVVLPKRKQDAKSKSKPAEKGGSNPIQRLRQNINDLMVFLPLLIPKSKATQRQMSFDFCIVLLCVGTDRLIKLASPILLRQVVDVLASHDPATKRLPWIEVVLFVLSHSILGSLISDVQYFFHDRITAKAHDVITLTLYNKLLDQSAEYHENNRSGSTWKDISQAGGNTIHYFSYLLFGQLPVVLDVFLGIATCWTVFDSSLALAMFAGIAAKIGLALAFDGKARAEIMEYIDARNTAQDMGLDTVQNWQTVSYFNRFQYERSRYGEAISKSRRLSSSVSQPLGWRGLLEKTVDCLGAGGVCLLGCYQIVNSYRSAGDFAMLFQFWTELASPIRMLVGIFSVGDRFLANNKKVFELLKLVPKVGDKQDAVDFEVGNGSIEFENVKFSYDGKREVVKDVSFRVEGGTTVAIVGETGGGKSTMFKLLCRAYDVTGGAVKIDGQDVRDVRMATLRDHISIVPQLIGVFNTSIYENLRYANLEATREQIEDACQAAALHKKIMSFPKGYDEKVGERGVKLSGGELQRLAIARALLRKAQIVLFDEATSNLDAETEARIQDYLRKWYQGRTVVVVAHRLATVSRADMIISFKDGAIVEAGKHDELLANKGYFYDLWNKQRLLWEPSKQNGKVLMERKGETNTIDM